MALATNTQSFEPDTFVTGEMASTGGTVDGLTGDKLFVGRKFTNGVSLRGGLSVTLTKPDGSKVKILESGNNVGMTDSEWALAGLPRSYTSVSAGIFAVPLDMGEFFDFTAAPNGTYVIDLHVSGKTNFASPCLYIPGLGTVYVKDNQPLVGRGTTIASWSIEKS